MSVVAFDGQMIASDSALTDTCTRVCKIGMCIVNEPRPFLDGLKGVCVFGVVGRPDDLARVNEFLQGGTDELDLGSGETDFSQALIACEGKAWLWQVKSATPIIGQAAIGTGGPVASCAMMLGQNAGQAVDCAIRLVDHCGPPVQALVLPSPEIGQQQAEPPEFHEKQGD